MSAAQDKKKPKSDGFDIGKSNAGKSKTDGSANKTARIAIITTAAIAVLFFGSLFINSNYFMRNFAAVKIDNVKYTVTDFNYYFEYVYMQYYNAVSSMGDMGSSMLPDTANGTLKSQIYDETTGQTWSDFFGDLALEQMKTDNKIYVEATKAGYQLTDDDKTRMEADIESLKTGAVANGYTSLNDYLKLVYGKSMDEATYRKEVERSYLITSYTNYMQESFTYTPEALETYYNENKDTFDTFTYRYFMVTAATVNESDYPDDDAAYQAAKAEAIAAAGVTANAFAAKITDEQTFIEAAREYDPETNKEDSATQRVYKGDLLGSTYGEWLRDASRQYGDVTTIESNNGYYVVFYGSRDNNHYKTVNIQQILVKPETIDKTLYESDTDTTNYDDAVAKAKQTAEETANKIYQEWLDGGATQEKLTELTTTYAAQISAADSVLTENVYKNQMPEAVNSWIYDTARKAGDHAVIYSEAMGYYIIDFVDQGGQYSDTLAETKQRETDLKTWQESLTGGEAKTTWLMTLTK